MLASLGNDLCRVDDASVTQVSSLGFFNDDRVPFQHIRRTNNGCCFHVQLAAGPGWQQKLRSKKRRTGYSTPDIPPVSVGRPVADDGHATAAVFVGFNVALI